MRCFDCGMIDKPHRMRPVYQLHPWEGSRHPEARLWRGKWVLLVCRRCYALKYAPWGVTYGK
jgi:hypothetical protein